MWQAPHPKTAANSKGFIGPIGDDLPSLIPLTVALLVFFGAFGFAFSNFEEKKMNFDQRLLVLGIGKTLKGDSLVDNYEKWKTACEGIEVARYNFRAVVFKISTDSGIAFHSYEFFSDWQKDDSNPQNWPAWTSDKRIFEMPNESGNPLPLMCDNDGARASVDWKPISSETGLARRPLRVNYPITVLEDNRFRPAILSVMVWNS